MIDRHNPSWPHTSLYVDSTKVIQRKEGITHVLYMWVSNLHHHSRDLDPVPCELRLWYSDHDHGLEWSVVECYSSLDEDAQSIKWMTIIQSHQNTKLTRPLRVIYLSLSTLVIPCNRVSPQDEVLLWLISSTFNDPRVVDACVLHLNSESLKCCTFWQWWFQMVPNIPKTNTLTTSHVTLFLKKLTER